MISVDATKKKLKWGLNEEDHETRDGEPWMISYWLWRIAAGVTQSIRTKIFSSSENQVTS